MGVHGSASKAPFGGSNSLSLVAHDQRVRDGPFPSHVRHNVPGGFFA